MLHSQRSTVDTALVLMLGWGPECGQFMHSQKLWSTFVQLLCHTVADVSHDIYFTGARALGDSKFGRQC